MQITWTNNFNLHATKMNNSKFLVLFMAKMLQTFFENIMLSEAKTTWVLWWKCVEMRTFTFEKGFLKSSKLIKKTV